jgi:hypothetical protein
MVCVGQLPRDGQSCALVASSACSNAATSSRYAAPSVMTVLSMLHGETTSASALAFVIARGQFDGKLVGAATK